MFEFLNPLFLIGLASAAIPLLIHLSRSRRTKKIQFSTTRFLTDHFLRSYRMSRLKELLLLACRMALCALFAMALARPMFLPRGDRFNLGQSRALVFVLDNSASMSYEEGGQTLFARAQTAARELLDSLKSGDTAAVVLAGRRAQGPESLFPELTSELGDVRQAIGRSEPAFLGTDLAAAVARAEELLRSSPAQSKEIYVLSDLQQTGWEAGSSQNDATGRLGALVFFVSVRPKQVENLSITAVQYAASRPMVGVPFVIRPHVRNQSETVRSCAVRLYVDGKKVGEQQIDKLQAGRWVVPRFHHTFEAGGWHNGYVEVDDPVLTADNRRYFTFKVVDSVNALAVNGAPSSVNRLDELFFLKTALTAAVEGKSPIHVDTVSTTGLGDKSLADYPLVILANVDRLALPVVEKLEQYVDAGGSLWMFLGDKANPSFYNDALAAPARLHGGLLPCRLNKIEGNPAGAQDFAYIGDTSADHPALAAFADAGFANLQGVTFKAYWGLEPPESGVLMRSNHGAPLLCEKSFGKGHTLVFASTCDRDWTNFPVRPAFLPWVYRLTAYLAQEPLSGQGFFMTGERVALPVSLGTAQIAVRKPDDTSSYIAPNPDAAQSTFLEDTVEPGVYSIAASKGGDDEERFAVNLESYESDLRYLDDVFAEQDGASAKTGRQERIASGFAGLLPQNPLVTFVADAGSVGEASLVARRGFKLWDLFLAVVLGIALFEPWFANRISMRMYLRANEGAAAPTPSAGPIERWLSRQAWLRRWLPERSI
jgi:hypothetical protein